MDTTHHTPKRGRKQIYKTPTAPFSTSMPEELKTLIGKNYAKLEYRSIGHFITQAAITALVAAGVHEAQDILTR